MENNKSFRRLKSFCITLLIILTVLNAIPLCAAGITEITFGEVKVEAGSEAVIPVSIKNNPGFSTFRFRITYDTDDLEFISVEKGAVLNDGTLSSVTDEEKKTVTFTWLSVADSEGDGEIAVMKFRTSDSALGEYILKVTFLPEDLINEDLQQVSYTVTDGKVRVVEKNVAVTGVTIDKTISVKIGEKKTPAYTVNPGNASNKTVSFVSNDPSVARVNETTGEITGVAKGKTTVTITTADGGFTGTCSVTVDCAHTSKTKIAEKASTCTERGWDTYLKCDICGQLFDNKGNEIAEIPYRDTLAHQYGEPEWIWNKEQWTAQAKFTCSLCGDEITVNAVVTKSEKNGVTTYTAKVDFDGRSFSDVIESGKPLFVPGDVNGDGSVNNKDVVTLFRYVAGSNVKVNEYALDVNGDGKVTNKDVVTLFRYVSGIGGGLSDKPYIRN
ncbi:MAG: Ig-like domain-containing protein [Clostridia bacterium]|nr:Ig-like domain-containing protein [Clostridia bacterium]MBO4423119.1 Ig-like domain-containing protein [Clostridia bacterium]